MHYQSLDDAVNLVARDGRRSLMAKADIESTFRLLPVHPEDFCSLGIMVNDNFYVDKALPFGIACAPAYFELFSTFVEWAARQNKGTDRYLSLL